MLNKMFERLGGAYLTNQSRIPWILSWRISGPDGPRVSWSVCTRDGELYAH